MLDRGECATRADLACKIGVSRARITQALKLLDLTPEVSDTTAALDYPLPRPIISEGMLARSSTSQPQSKCTLFKILPISR